jgi:trans-2,3-dihydro-3-hydroxyanthranilate isomerase
MQYSYYLCDVFTNKQFTGNQLAVLPNALGLTTEQMQKIATEFNFSECTFVFPPEQEQSRKVRIFTPTTEIPFAGHPNIGTAYVLTQIHDQQEFERSSEIVFEEKAGLVSISIIEQGSDSKLFELKAPEKLSLGITVNTQLMAEAIGLEPTDIATSTHQPIVASIGLPFIITELTSVDALSRAKVNMDGFEKLAALGIAADVHIYVKSDDKFDIRVRMFAPFDNVPEDPATGSANCALAGLVAKCHERQSGQFNWHIAQGVEMGRPSELFARAEKLDGQVVGTWIAGSCVLVSKGSIYLA